MLSGVGETLWELLKPVELPSRWEMGIPCIKNDFCRTAWAILGANHCMRRGRLVARRKIIFKQIYVSCMWVPVLFVPPRKRAFSLFPNLDSLHCIRWKRQIVSKYRLWKFKIWLGAMERKNRIPKANDQWLPGKARNIERKLFKTKRVLKILSFQLNTSRSSRIIALQISNGYSNHSLQV